MNEHPCEGCPHQRARGGCLNYRRCMKWRAWFRVEWARAVREAKEYLKARREKEQ